MKVLFLDIDGVVLSGEELWATGNNRYLPPAKIALVNEVLRRTGSLVVVSSTWRCFDECLDLLRAAGLTAIHRDWRTDRESRTTGGLYIGEVRGHQIKRWLDAHPEVDSYAIVDDDADMLPEQMPRFVQTPFVTGIGQEHVERLARMLNTPVTVTLVDPPHKS